MKPVSPESQKKGSVKAVKGESVKTGNEGREESSREGRQKLEEPALMKGESKPWENRE